MCQLRLETNYCHGDKQLVGNSKAAPFFMKRMNKTQKRRLSIAIQRILDMALQNGCTCNRNGNQDYDSHSAGCYVRDIATDFLMVHQHEIDLEADAR